MSHFWNDESELFVMPRTVGRNAAASALGSSADHCRDSPHRQLPRVLPYCLPRAGFNALFCPQYCRWCI